MDIEKYIFWKAWNKSCFRRVIKMEKWMKKKKKVLIIVLSSFVFIYWTACDSSSSIDAKSLAKTKIEAEKKEFEPTLLFY